MYTPNYRKKRKKKHRKKNRALKTVFIVAVSILLLCGIGMGTYEYLLSAGKKSLKTNGSTAAPDLARSETAAKDGEEQKDYDPTIYTYHGTKYKYNENITTILCLGVDPREEEFTEKETYGDSGQADTIFLLVLDPRENAMKLIGVSRDTMVEMENYDLAGNPVGKSKNHLGLAYAYGDGKEESCERMVSAVSELFYGLPIHGYVSLLMSAIPSINDAVGGVPVTVPEDLTQWDPDLGKGAQLTLSGQQALYFVARRDTSVEGSNNLRMARQKQYALSFMARAKAAVKQNPTLTVSLYKDLSSRMVTDIGLDKAVYLASQVVGMGFDEKNILMVEGTTTGANGVYDEFYADDEKLLQLVLDTFYLKS